MNNSRRGFTLIELLVVIAIIGILSSVVLASLNSARKKSRDARRIADLKQIQLALEMYYSDNNTYPQPSQGWSVWSGHCPTYGNNDNYIVGLAPNYISVLPLDPVFDTTKYCYLYRSDGVDYKVLAHQTIEGVSCPPLPTDYPFYERRSAVQCTIGVCSSGAVDW